MQKNIAKGAASLYLSNIVSLFVITGHFIVLTNTLDITEIGIIFGFQIIMYLFATLATFCLPIPIMSPLPLPHAITKFIPEFIASKEKGKANTIFLYSLYLLIIISLILSILIFVNIDIINSMIFNGKITNGLLFIALTQIFLFTLNQFLFSGMISIGNSYKVGIIQIYSIVIKFTFAAILAYAGFGIIGVLAGYLIGDLLFTILALPICLNKLKSPKQEINRFAAINYSVPILISSLIIFGVTQIDRIYALINLGLPGLGIYTIAIAASTIGAYAPNSLATAITPNLSALFSLNKLDSFRNLSKLYTRYVSFIGMPAAFMIAALSVPLMSIFGEQYVDSARPAAVISIAIGITTFSSIYNSQLFVRGKTKWIMFANISGLLVFISMILISQVLNNSIDVNYLSYGRALMIVSTALIISYKSYTLGDLKYDRKAIINSLLGSIIMSVSLYYLYTVLFSSVSSTLSLLVLIPTGMAIYFIYLRQTRTFNQKDIEFIVKIISINESNKINTMKKILGIKN
ncbi:MAG: oligosaccharide flippase family protein [Nitrososphaerales archaeon]